MTWNIIRLNSEWRGQIVGSPMLLVKSKLRLHSYGERTRGRQRSLNVRHVLWRDRSKHLHTRCYWTPIALGSGALFVPLRQKLWWRHEDCAFNKTHFFSKLESRTNCQWVSNFWRHKIYKINYVSKNRIPANYTISSFWNYVDASRSCRVKDCGNCRWLRASLGDSVTSLLFGRIKCTFSLKR